MTPIICMLVAGAALVLFTNAEWRALEREDPRFVDEIRRLTGGKK